MARELRRLLIPRERLADRLVLEPAEAHYLGRVLRLRPGDRFELVDGAGSLWSARLDRSDLALLEQPLQAPLQVCPPPDPLLELAVALPRRDSDVLLRMVVELGIDRILPLRAERSIGSDAPRPERGAAIVREAVEQCERLWQPELRPPLAAAALLGSPPSYGQGWGLLACSRQPGRPLLQQMLSSLAARCTSATSGLVLAVGPEGGWSPAEEGLALENGWQPVSLGQTILRCSTANVAAAALLGHWRESLVR
ncbi:MAG: 16S rRNA (uracil(1498)-N(3))-methyltransferase [Synechococcus sp.]|nr:16S rRNA (uracil(1498)-N(3))-methyltransferase [Synechococcus sp.]